MANPRLAVAQLRLQAQQSTPQPLNALVQGAMQGMQGMQELIKTKRGLAAQAAQLRMQMEQHKLAQEQFKIQTEQTRDAEKRAKDLHTRTKALWPQQDEATAAAKIRAQLDLKELKQEIETQRKEEKIREQTRASYDRIAQQLAQRGKAAGGFYQPPGASPGTSTGGTFNLPAAASPMPQPQNAAEYEALQKMTQQEQKRSDVRFEYQERTKLMRAELEQRGTLELMKAGLDPKMNPLHKTILTQAMQQMMQKVMVRDLNLMSRNKPEVGITPEDWKEFGDILKQSIEKAGAAGMDAGAPPPPPPPPPGPDPYGLGRFG